MPVKIVITPIKFKDKTYPIKAFERVEKALIKYMKSDLGPDLNKEFLKTTKGWSNPPSFPPKVTTPYGTRIQLDIGPAGKGKLHWIYVSAGTGPRTIHAKSAGGMVFPKEYTPRTRPGGKYGGPGLRHGEIQRRQTVYNHEIKAREFSKEIATPAWERKVIKDINGVVDKALR